MHKISGSPGLPTPLDAFGVSILSAFGASSRPPQISHRGYAHGFLLSNLYGCTQSADADCAASQFKSGTKFATFRTPLKISSRMNGRTDNRGGVQNVVHSFGRCRVTRTREARYQWAPRYSHRTSLSINSHVGNFAEIGGEVIWLWK